MILPYKGNEVEYEVNEIHKNIIPRKPTNQNLITEENIPRFLINFFSLQIEFLLL